MVNAMAAGRWYEIASGSRELFLQGKANVLDWVRHLVLFTLTLPVAAAVLASPPGDAVEPADMEVTVRKDGERLQIDASLYVDASIPIVWSVLTDFEQAPTFLSDLEYSTVERREENVFFVRQKGRAKFGPLEFPVESYRRIELFQNERVVTRLLRGTMKQLDGTVTIKAEGTGTRITSQTALVPDFWLPPLIGRLFVEHEARERFTELWREMLRRNSRSMTEHDASTATQTQYRGQSDGSAQGRSR